MTASDASTSARPSGALAAWGRVAVRYRWLVLATWLAAVLALLGVWCVAGGRFVSDFSVPGTESQAARDLLRERFPQQAGDPAYVVMVADRGFADPGVRARVDAYLPEFRRLPEVVTVASPYDGGGRSLSDDGSIAIATLAYGARDLDVSPASKAALFALVDRLNSDGDRLLHLEVGGPVVQLGEVAPPGRAELIGLAAAAVVLFVAFGSLTAMGLPVVTAIFGLACGLVVTSLAARSIPMTAFTPAFGGMIGIGVGIDYALLIVSRYRSELARTHDVAEAVAGALDTAGRSVVFAGSAVVIALGLFVVGIQLQTALGVAGAIVVAASVLVAMTLLPALLGIVGTRIDRWSVSVRRTTDAVGPNSLWYRLAARIQRRPARYALAALALLLVLTLPMTRMRLGSSDAGNQPEAMRSRRAYDLVSRGFGPGANSPLLLAVDLPAGGDAATLARIVDAVRETEGVTFVAPPRLNAGRDAAVITIVPRGAPQDESTTTLVRDLRTEVFPRALNGTSVRVHVGGITATFGDVAARMAERMPQFFALVIGLSVVLLAIVFRSIAVPLKAAAMNLLSIGAAYGVLVAVFQWGWFDELVRAGRPGPIESFVPMLLFAILFGLSMDYEVFLLSRIRENWAAGMDNGQAVTHGLAQTARVITAAAAIMVAVFLSFALSEGRVIKEFGIGLGTAILVDATIVRVVLVPSLMELLGDANWWLPAWLDRLLPQLQVERTRLGSAK